jgi:hypothetical protein
MQLTRSINNAGKYVKNTIMREIQFTEATQTLQKTFKKFCSEGLP